MKMSELILDKKLNNNSKNDLNSGQKLNIYKFLWKTIKVRKFFLFLLLIFMIAHDVFGVFLAQYFNKSMVNGASNNIPFHLCILYLIMYAFFQNVQYIDTSIMYKLIFNSITKIKNNLRNNIYSYVIKHSMDYFNNSFSGSLNKKINSIVEDSGKLVELIVDFSSTVILTIIAPILYSTFNIYIGLSFTLISIFYVLALVKLRKFSIEKVKKLTENKNKYFGLINDDFTNISNIKIFSHEKVEIRNVKKINNEILRSAYDFLKIRFVYSLINFVFCFIFIFAILATSAYILSQNKINIGDFMFIMIVASIFNFIIRNTSRKIAKFVDISGKLENNLNELMQPIEIANKKNASDLVVTGGRIVFRNVSFGYKKGGKNAR